MANETTVGMTFTWRSTVVTNSHASEATLDDAINTVDCTALGDLSTDLRAGTKNPTGSFTHIIGKGGTVPSVGDVGTLAVDGASYKMLVSGVGRGGAVNGVRTARVTLVSTLADPTT
jgi:hypothetical protein